jgi:hypothetical protein
MAVERGRLKGLFRGAVETAPSREAVERGRLFEAVETRPFEKGPSRPRALKGRSFVFRIAVISGVDAGGDFGHEVAFDESCKVQP